MLRTREPLAANPALGHAQCSARTGALQDLPKSTDANPGDRPTNMGMGTPRIDQQPPSSSLTQLAPCPQDQAHLLQRGRAELDGDVVELLVLLGAEVADDVGVFIRLSEQLDLTVHEMETLRQEALHSHVPAIKLSPAQSRRWRSCTALPSQSRAQRCRCTALPGSG